MLNYNKIHSSINMDRTSKRKLADFLGISNSTFVDRLNKENFTPDDIEKLSDFFRKPLDYWFDREEQQAAEPPAQRFEKKEPTLTVYECQECIEKEKEIDELEKENKRLRDKLERTQDDLIDALRGKQEKRTG